MATRSSGNTTALRRLMTEYKQLTASGLSSLCCTVFTILLLTFNSSFPSQARPMACSQPVRDPAIHRRPVQLSHDLFILRHHRTPRSYFRIRLLHMGGPRLRAKRYALCNIPNFSLLLLKFIMFLPPFPPPTLALSQEGGVFTAKLSFVRRISFHISSHLLFYLFMYTYNC